MSYIFVTWFGVSCSRITNQPWNSGGGVVFKISLSGCETANLLGWMTNGWGCLLAANAGTISSRSNAPNRGAAKLTARELFIDPPANYVKTLKASGLLATPHRISAPKG